jgi:branched-chain amino acid aminotransferase
MRTFEAISGRLQEVAAAASLPAGAYSTLRTYGRTRVYHLADHLHRLDESARLQGQPGELAPEAVRAALRDALAATGHAESRVRLTWAPPRLFVGVEPFTALPESAYREGVWCVTVPLRRDNPHAKDTRFLGTAADAYAHLPAGAHEGLMVAEDGAILEGLSSNFFAVMGGALHTEEDRVLAGLTRSLALHVAADLLPRAARALRHDEVGRAEECFITSASRGVLPVVRIDETVVGTGAPGPLSRELRARYERRVDAEAEDVASA